MWWTLTSRNSYFFWIVFNWYLKIHSSHLKTPSTSFYASADNSQRGIHPFPSQSYFIRTQLRRIRGVVEETKSLFKSFPFEGTSTKGLKTKHIFKSGENLLLVSVILYFIFLSIPIISTSTRPVSHSLWYKTFNLILWKKEQIIHNSNSNRKRMLPHQDTRQHIILRVCEKTKTPKFPGRKKGGPEQLHVIRIAVNKSSHFVLLNNNGNDRDRCPCWKRHWVRMCLSSR